jgi:hypothetical protein
MEVNLTDRLNVSVMYSGQVILEAVSADEVVLMGESTCGGSAQQSGNGHKLIYMLEQDVEVIGIKLEAPSDESGEAFFFTVTNPARDWPTADLEHALQLSIPDTDGNPRERDAALLRRAMEHFNVKQRRIHRTPGQMIDRAIDWLRYRSRRFLRNARKHSFA